MTSKNISKKPVAVLGAGSFGTAIANLLANNRKVLFYARNAADVESMQITRERRGVPLHEDIEPCGNLEEICKTCNILFPIVPSDAFRSLIHELSPYLRPYHILIHGTKGFDVSPNVLTGAEAITRDSIKTMSEVILEESVVVQVGCLAGPNLAGELFLGQPAATVVASLFDKVILEGQSLLKNENFRVYGNPDIIGIELCGILKNIIAIASGALNGMGFGQNASGLLISRGLIEMIYLGKALGGNTQAFIGLAGVGDLVTTCSSHLSRNYSLGFQLAKGETLNDILQKSDEVAEGVNTIKITKHLADHYNVSAPITQTLYKILFEDMPVNDALSILMKVPLNVDIDL